MEFIHQQKANGCLVIDYSKDKFISITDEATGQQVRFHTSLLKILNQTTKENEKYLAK